MWQWQWQWQVNIQTFNGCLIGFILNKNYFNKKKLQLSLKVYVANYVGIRCCVESWLLKKRKT